MNAGHRAHGNPAPTRRALGGWFAAGVLVLAALGVAGVVGTPTSAQSGSGPGGTVVSDGATLYLESCASCHGPKGEGTNAGPSLVGVGAAAADFYLRTGRMPLGAPDQRPVRQQPRFNDAQIAALVNYVASFGPGPEIPQVATGGDVHRGFELFSANCAACHAATGAGNAVGGGFYAVGLGQATNTEIAEAMLVGPGVMPKFSMSPEEQAAIVAYVDFLRSEPTPGGAPIGGIGPVAEGFVAIVIGLPILVLVAMYVGRRTRDAADAAVMDAGEHR